MKTHILADPVRYLRMTTSELREAFLIGSLHQPGSIQLAYVDLDRAVVGIAAPGSSPLTLQTDDALKASYFTERRELGVLNIGGSGSITVEGKATRSITWTASILAAEIPPSLSHRMMQRRLRSSIF